MKRAKKSLHQLVSKCEGGGSEAQGGLQGVRVGAASRGGYSERGAALKEGLYDEG